MSTKIYLRLTSFVLLGILGVVGHFTSMAQSGERILFTSDRDGVREIYSMLSDGTQIQRLTFTQAENREAVWSPDRQTIAFASNRDGNFAIYTMRVDGADLHKLTPDDGSYNDAPAWSPDGRQIAFVSDRTGNLEIHVMNADGSNPHLLTYHPAEDNEPSWSPDGQKIAFSSNREGFFEIYTISANGESPHCVICDLDTDNYSPAWSPDGTQIAFVSFNGWASEINVIEHTGQNLRLLTSVTDYFAGSTTWSPDGQFIAYAIWKSATPAAIQVIDINGQSARQLTETTAFANWPAWSTPFVSGVVVTPSGPAADGLHVGGRAQVYVTDEGLKLRAGPGTDYRIIENLPRGTTVTIIGDSQNRQGYTWWNVRSFNGNEGWSVEFADGLNTLVPIPALHIGGQAQVYVEDEGLKLRAGPGTDYQIIENLPRGSVLTVLDGPQGRGGYTWWKLRAMSGNEGWSVEAADGLITLVPLP